MAVDLRTEATISGTAELLEIVVLLTPVVQMQSVVLAGGREPFFDDLALDKERINRKKIFEEHRHRVCKLKQNLWHGARTLQEEGKAVHVEDHLGRSKGSNSKRRSEAQSHSHRRDEA